MACDRARPLESLLLAYGRERDVGDLTVLVEHDVGPNTQLEWRGTDMSILASAQPEDSVKVFALQWYLQMQAGQIDRTQLTGAYSAQLTDLAVQQMSRRLNHYGASPRSAEILQSRTVEDQTFQLVKFHFPRGDAASLLFGFGADGKITGIALTMLAGD